MSICKKFSTTVFQIGVFINIRELPVIVHEQLLDNRNNSVALCLCSNFIQRLLTWIVIPASFIRHLSNDELLSLCSNRSARLYVLFISLLAALEDHIQIKGL